MVHMSNAYMFNFSFFLTTQLLFLVYSALITITWKTLKERQLRKSKKEKLKYFKIKTFKKHLIFLNMLVLSMKREWLYSYYFFQISFWFRQIWISPDFHAGKWQGKDKGRLLGSDRAKTRDICFAYNSSLPTGCKRRITCKEEFQFHSAVSWYFFPSQELDYWLPITLQNDVIDPFILKAPNENTLINWTSICI